MFSGHKHSLQRLSARTRPLPSVKQNLAPADLRDSRLAGDVDGALFQVLQEKSAAVKDAEALRTRGAQNLSDLSPNFCLKDRRASVMKSELEAGCCFVLELQKLIFDIPRKLSRTILL